MEPWPGVSWNRIFKCVPPTGLSKGARSTTSLSVTRISNLITSGQNGRLAFRGMIQTTSFARRESAPFPCPLFRLIANTRS